MVTSSYRNVEIGRPAGIAAVSNRTEHHVGVVPTMAPGTARALVDGEDRIEGTQDDRITFSNGGSIEDQPGESGLVLTTPDGQRLELENHGWIETNADKNRVEVNFTLENPVSGDTENWNQAFNADGSVILERQPASSYDTLNVTVAPDGSTIAHYSDYGGGFDPEVALRNGAFIFDDPGMQRMAIAPPVPMEWLIKA